MQNPRKTVENPRKTMEKALKTMEKPWKTMKKSHGKASEGIVSPRFLHDVHNSASRRLSLTGASLISNPSLPVRIVASHNVISKES